MLSCVQCNTWSLSINHSVVVNLLFNVHTIVCEGPEFGPRNSMH